MFDHRYLRDERLFVRVAVALGVVVGLLAFFLARELVPERSRVSPVAVWDYVHEVAPDRGIDPEFVYALAWAESSLDPRARSSVARGIMQLTKPAWREVSDASYRHAWDWKTNIRVGVDYLAFCKEFLQRHDSFNYPLLAASYRYGPYYVKNNNFNLKQLTEPKNEIYRRIFEGITRPVAPPER
ncbi:MAG: transglycosylase SLT domain-containing protein [Opitutales bacterium]